VFFIIYSVVFSSFICYCSIIIHFVNEIKKKDQQINSMLHFIMFKKFFLSIITMI
jgi:hypothetical protein